MKSFFHTLKVELAHQRRWETRDEARRDLFAYIEGYYNRRWIQGSATELPIKPRDRRYNPSVRQNGEPSCCACSEGIGAGACIAANVIISRYHTIEGANRSPSSSTLLPISRITSTSISS